MPPDVFAIVMATGIVSTAADDHDYHRIAVVLGVVSLIAFAVLLALGAAGIVSAPRRAESLLHDPDVALRSFTFVAACAVLGSRFGSEHPWCEWAFGCAALIAWLGLAPAAILDVRSRAVNQLRDHAHGGWLLAAVATQSLAVCAADLAIHSTRRLLIAASLAWLLGLALYLAVAVLILWRAFAHPFEPDEVGPDSWILMGGLAIAALASARIARAAAVVPATAWLSDSARVATAVLLVATSVWIPLLLYAEVWSVDQRAGSLHYAGVWWATVFPLGMYASASWAGAVELPAHALRTVSLVFFWIAATVWLLVATGLTHRALGRLAR